MAWNVHFHSVAAKFLLIKHGVTMLVTSNCDISVKKYSQVVILFPPLGWIWINDKCVNVTTKCDELVLGIIGHRTRYGTGVRIGEVWLIRGVDDFILNIFVYKSWIALFIFRLPINVAITRDNPHISLLYFYWNLCVAIFRSALH